jgi:KaiC/GvpD/RAD55 family RecA-like ATPase
MRFLAGGEEFNELLESKMGAGKCILLKYGPGTGGDMILKQFLSEIPEGTRSIYISTHETEEELLSAVSELDLPSDLELVSVYNDLTSYVEDLMKKDRFRTDGIMVTDLLEVSSNTSFRRGRRNGGREVLSRISSISMKQVLPFRMVVDSLVDLVRKATLYEVESRIQILKRAVKEKNGTVILGAPLDWDGMKEIELTLFDAVFHLSGDKSSGTWKRILTLHNLKGSPLNPDEWEVTRRGNIQNSKSLK